MLTRVEKLMDRTSETEIDVTFESLDGNGGLLVLPMDDWREMEMPEEITVAVYPGDLLNEEDYAFQKREAAAVPAREGTEARSQVGAQVRQEDEPGEALKEEVKGEQ